MKFCKIILNIWHKNKLMREINNFQWLSYKTSPKARIIEIESRIKKLNSIDRIKKFFMDIINQFDKFCDCENKRQGNKKLFIYLNFVFYFIIKRCKQ